MVVTRQDLRGGMKRYHSTPVREEHLAEPLPISNGWLQECWSSSVKDSALFDLPTEILEQVVDKMSRLDLAAFALVNSDCRGLARTRQFASLIFRFGREAKESPLLEYLRKEVSGGLESVDSRLLPIHKCIRYVQVSLGHYGHDDFNDAGFLESFLQESGSSTKDQKHVDKSYIKLRDLIPKLANLTTISCRARSPHTLLTNSATEFPIKNLVHLKLVEFSASRDFFSNEMRSLEPLMSMRTLQTLHLVAPPSQSVVDHGFCTFLLIAASSTLKRLYLQDYDFTPHSRALQKIFEAEPLSALEQLQLVRTRLCPWSHRTIFHASKRLSHVRVTLAESTIDYDSIPSLTSVHVRRISRSVDRVPNSEFEKLLSNNSHVAAIETSGSVLRQLEVGPFLEAVVSYVPGLTSLSFNINHSVPGTNQIMYKSNWALVSRLRHLQKLRISGVSFSHNLDHNGFKDFLAPLQNLKTLVLQDTTYKFKGNYDAADTAKDALGNVKEAKEAEELSRLLPKLELVALRYFVFRIVRDASGGISARRLLMPISDLEQLFVVDAGFQEDKGAWTRVH